MSEPLTEPAPVEASADTPVGEGSADAPEAAVDEASGHGEKVIPVERFNGLMSKFNSTQEELAQMRTRTEALEAQLQSQLAEGNREEPQEVADSEAVAALQAQVNQLTELLLSERAGSTKSQLLAKYPEAAPFAELINIDAASSPEEAEAVVAQVAQIAKTIGNTGEVEPPAEGEAPPAAGEATPPQAEAEVPPDTGAGPGVVPGDGPVGSEDSVQSALKSGNFQAWLRAKTEKAQGEGDLALTA